MYQNTYYLKKGEKASLPHFNHYEEEWLVSPEERVFGKEKQRIFSLHCACFLELCSAIILKTLQKYACLKTTKKISLIVRCLGFFLFLFSDSLLLSLFMLDTVLVKKTSILKVHHLKCLYEKQILPTV